eukprot:TRINITY_DN34946_c0_g1_i1.p1 TRINITY_DN34946_c0_g1~~TRINITY_DN34946_c0_g1_i1.p1  ORF type:complete len:178 (+),score=36.06 TRINITY_DN34946_c0_g1_i1:48-536(+)
MFLRISQTRGLRKLLQRRWVQQPGEVQEPKKEDGEAKTIWEDFDTAKEIHQGMATEGFEDVEIKPEHYAMGVRAFAYGTILAVFGVGCTSYIGGRYMGFTHWRDAISYLRNSPERAALNATTEGLTVYRHDVDLLDPSTWRETWDAIVTDVQKIEDEKKKNA